MSRSFLHRLDDASAHSKKEAKDITPTKSPHFRKKTPSSDKDTKEEGIIDSKNVSNLNNPSQTDQNLSVSLNNPKNSNGKYGSSELLEESCDSLTTHSLTEAEIQRKFDAELAEYRAKETLVTRCAEYIFDLFDANCLEDYKTMDAFETMALDSFTDFESTEITFEQHQLHKEFLELFERLISKFLKEEGCSVEDFHAMTQGYLQGEDAEADSKEKAQEVVDVIFAYTDLQLWASAMRKRAQLRHKYRQEHATREKKSIQLPHTALEEAMNKHYHKIPANSHRFDTK